MQDHNYLILIVVENAELRNLISQKLTNENIRMLEVEHVRQALEQLQANKIDLIVLDLSVTEAEGFEYSTTINRYIAGTKIPIIVFSSKNLTSIERVSLNGKIEINIPKGKKGIESVIKEIKKVLK